MEDLLNNEYVHMGVSLICIAWAVRNIQNKKNNSNTKGKKKTFEFMDNIYSYLLILFAAYIIIWSFYNIVNGEVV